MLPNPPAATTGLGPNGACAEPQRLGEAANATFQLALQYGDEPAQQHQRPIRYTGDSAVLSFADTEGFNDCEVLPVEG